MPHTTPSDGFLALCRLIVKSYMPESPSSRATGSWLLASALPWSAENALSLTGMPPPDTVKSDMCHVSSVMCHLSCAICPDVIFAQATGRRATLELSGSRRSSERCGFTFHTPSGVLAQGSGTARSSAWWWTGCGATDAVRAREVRDDLAQQVRKNDKRDRTYVFVRIYGNIARRLAADAPADAGARVLERVRGLDPANASRYALAVCSKMAYNDPMRARRIAGRCLMPARSRIKPYALGLIAQETGLDRRPDAGNRSFGLCLRHLLPGLGPSAPVAARRPRPVLHRVQQRPARRRPARLRSARGDQEAVTIIAWSVEWMR